MGRKSTTQEYLITASQPNLPMKEIITILNVLSPALTPLTLKHLSIIVEAMFSMTGRVTMLGLSRWQLIKRHLTGADDVWLLLGDEVMVTKSGKETHGLRRFNLQ